MVTTHSRGGHAERVAMLTCVRTMLCLIGDLSPACKPADLASCMSGNVWLYVSHWPCISCLAVFSQFAALCPGVRLRVTWDGYAEHTEPHAPPENCRVWTCGPHTGSDTIGVRRTGPAGEAKEDASVTVADNPQDAEGRRESSVLLGHPTTEAVVRNDRGFMGRQASADVSTRHGHQPQSFYITRMGARARQGTQSLVQSFYGQNA